MNLKDLIRCVLLLGIATAGPFAALAQTNPPTPGAGAPSDPPVSANSQAISALPASGAGNPPSSASASAAKPVSVFGQWMFSGRFAAQSFSGFNPDYLINVGDNITLRLWGAVEAESALVVDPQGNVFVPRVGPVRVLNVRNEELNGIIAGKVQEIYQKNVGVYASLNAAQPVRVFVSGFVLHPGMYSGFSGDSALHFLDLAGGVDPARGSFLDVRVLRGGLEKARINLYRFLLQGEMPLLQFHDGDIVVVGALQRVVQFTGLVQNPYSIEFSGDTITLGNALRIAGPQPHATHARITRNRGLQHSVDYVLLKDAATVVLHDGDQVELVADQTQHNFVVYVEGEHLGPSQFALLEGATLGDLLVRMKPTPESDMGGVQIFRRSIAVQQKERLQQTLMALQTQVLSARSDSVQEANLREREAGLVLKFIDRAQSVQPKGQVILLRGDERLKVKLEAGDRIRVPKNSLLVSVQGEVYFPSTFLFRDGADLEDYIESAGGFTQQADRSKILIIHQNGVINVYRRGLFNSAELLAGDEILVLPDVDTKGFQFAKDVVEALYQLAITAGVALRFGL